MLPHRLDRWHPVSVTLSVAALAALVVGVPIVLVVLGGVPFLHDGLTRIQRSVATTQTGDPRVAARWIATVALVLAWSVWVWAILCVGIELRSWFTGRPPARLPASRTAQSVAAFLVGTTLAVSAVGRGVTVPSQRAATPASAGPASFGPSGRSAADVVPIADLFTAATSPSSGVGSLGWCSADGAVHGSTAPTPEADSGAVPPSSGPMPSDPGRAAGPTEKAARRVEPVAQPGPVDALAVPRTHLVCSRETLWSIAEAELGTALRWQELAELNYGIRQQDGRALDEGHWISPGWLLLLPPPGGPNQPTVPLTPVDSAPGLHAERSAQPRSVDRARPAELAEAPRPAPPLPSHAVADPRAETDSERRTDLDTAPHPRSLPRPVRSPSAPSVPVVPLGAGVVGAGVARLLDRMRQVQQRYRAEGRLIKVPTGASSQFEWRLRIGDSWGLSREVDEAIRQHARSNLETQGEPAMLVGVRVHPEVIELVPFGRGGPIIVDRTVLASAPSSTTTSTPGGTPVVDTPGAVAPLLVTVGRGSSGPVMVNLEALGSLVVSGNPDAADAVVRALALELATSFWSGQFSLTVVGFGSELERFDGVRYYPEVADLVHTLCRRQIAAAAQLDVTEHSSFTHARLAEVSDRWSPLVVLCGPTVTGGDVNELLEVAANPVLGTAVVAVGERIEAQYSVRIDGGDGVEALALLAEVVVPQRIEPDELDQVSALLDTAASRQSVLRSDEPYVNLPIRLPQAADPDLDEVSPPTDHAVTDAAEPPQHGGMPVSGDAVEVAVLGPVEVRGAARPFTRAWAEELVIYLAMHPNGASNDAWAAALWPDRLMAPSSLHSIASVARRSLGQAADGTDYLPRSHGRLALVAAVRTDWDRFVALADSDSTEGWHAALTLIRGRPFEGLRSSDWPILEGIAPAIEAAIVDLSGRLAGAYLHRGDARGAEWAARRGLLVSPYDERLYRMLMRAADLGGNPAGVDAAMSELLTLVADGIEPLDAVHPNTMELYRQLSRRKKFGASGR